MILPDTSIWIDYFRTANARMAALVEAEEVLVHPFVIGELAMGRLRSREQTLSDLCDMEPAILVADDDVLRMVEIRALHGRGIGFVDAHLLASVLHTPEAKLWTRDKRLRAIAAELGVDANPAAPLQ